MWVKFFTISYSILQDKLDHGRPQLQPFSFKGPPTLVSGWFFFVNTQQIRVKLSPHTGNSQAVVSSRVEKTNKKAAVRILVTPEKAGHCVTGRRGFKARKEEVIPRNVEKKCLKIFIFMH